MFPGIILWASFELKFSGKNQKNKLQFKFRDIRSLPRVSQPRPKAVHVLWIKYFCFYYKTVHANVLTRPSRSVSVLIDQLTISQSTSSSTFDIGSRDRFSLQCDQIVEVPVTLQRLSNVRLRCTLNSAQLVHAKFEGLQHDTRSPQRSRKDRSFSLNAWFSYL